MPVAVQFLRHLSRLELASNWEAPAVEFEDGDLIAELAWVEPTKRIVVLVDDQAYFAPRWCEAGWRVVELYKGQLPDDAQLFTLFQKIERS